MFKLWQIISPKTVLLAVCLAGGLMAAERWQRLLERNPFLPDEAAKPKASEPPPPYEFRGRSVENGVEYFSLYNLETKKALWVGPADDGDLRVQTYRPGSELVLVDHAGRTIRLALKESRSAGGIRVRPGTALASAPANTAPAAVAVPLAAPESQRLEQVAEQIRHRRAQRQQVAGSRI